MKRKRHTPEQVTRKLREAEALIEEGGVFQGGRDWRAPLTRQQTGWLAATTVG